MKPFSSGQEDLLFVLNYQTLSWNLHLRAFSYASLYQIETISAPNFFCLQNLVIGDLSHFLRLRAWPDWSSYFFLGFRFHRGIKSHLLQVSEACLAWSCRHTCAAFFHLTLEHTRHLKFHFCRFSHWDVKFWYHCTYLLHCTPFLRAHFAHCQNLSRFGI